MTLLASAISKELTRDLEWREAELALMRKDLIRTTKGSLHEQALLRANVAMLYAHYEGFCKFALGVYLEALGKLRIQRKHLNWRLATFSMGELKKELISKGDSAAFFSAFMDGFNTRLEEQVTQFEQIPSISNLWPDLLIEWLDRLALESNYIATEGTLLDSLVSARNQIAHGKKLTINSREALDKYANVAELAMHTVAVGIVDSIQKRTYLRHSIVHTIFNHAVQRT
ncbi:MAE_28990/MAE_18760 family HEPN-like nuclease [Uliginosibacterium sediminicola]|uniref:MAE_28990/MAE_18760 family HEPN-like nuclease n=1 Tax=Uliginosibacterium sediminicola TaxID=2024550 RepID=A0ABU9Z3P8_9RHOO